MHRQAKLYFAATIAFAFALPGVVYGQSKRFITQPNQTSPVIDQQSNAQEASEDVPEIEPSDPVQVDAPVGQQEHSTGGSRSQTTALQWVPSVNGQLVHGTTQQPSPEIAVRTLPKLSPQENADALPRSQQPIVSPGQRLQSGSKGETQPQIILVQPEPKSPSADESRRDERFKLASQISDRIVGSSQRDPIGGRVEPLNPPPGWQSVGSKLSRHIASCETLVRRGAYFSAREEAAEGVLYLVQVLGQHANSSEHELHWIRAQNALTEADDFVSISGGAANAQRLRQLINAHTTTILKNRDVSGISPLTAAAHYRAEATRLLVLAAHGHPWGSEAYYAIGRVYQAQADAAANDNSEDLKRKAIAYLKAAAETDPENALALNQLGFLWLQFDRPGNAAQALAKSIQAEPSLSAFANLIQASQRMQDTNTQQWAMAEYQRLRANTPPVRSTPPVVEVPVQTFIALSPYEGGPTAR